MEMSNSDQIYDCLLDANYSVSIEALQLYFHGSTGLLYQLPQSNIYHM